MDTRGAYYGHRGNNLHNTLQTMKAFFLYIAIGCVAVNVAGNAFQNTAEGIKATQAARSAQLCEVAPKYCA